MYNTYSSFNLIPSYINSYVMNTLNTILRNIGLFFFGSLRRIGYTFLAIAIIWAAFHMDEIENFLFRIVHMIQAIIIDCLNWLLATISSLGGLLIFVFFIWLGYRALFHKKAPQPTKRKH